MNVTEFKSHTLLELEQLSGVDKFRWSKYFSGKISPNISTLEKVADRLEMDVEDLMLAIRLKKQDYSNRKKVAR